MVLIERDYSDVRGIARNIKGLLLNLKSKVLDSDKETLEILDIFNSRLKRLGVLFEISEFNNFGLNADYKEVGIHYGSIDSSGIITIYVFDEFYDCLDIYNYENFCSVVHSILIHELTHLQQLEKAKDYFDTTDDLDDEILYLKKKQEIQAHANQAVDRMIGLGYEIEDINKILRSPRSSKIMPEEVDAYWKYYDIFYGEYGDKIVWNRFLKYCYQYLDDLEE